MANFYKSLVRMNHVYGPSDLLRIDCRKKIVSKFRMTGMTDGFSSDPKRELSILEDNGIYFFDKKS
jgi:hypothetical protein